MRVASFGYPDILASREELEAILGDRIDDLKYRPDSEAIMHWHHVERNIPDAHSFFGLLGGRLEVYDIAEHRGGEIFLDLNEENRALRPGYDIVLDVGTMEHCFNIGQAALNMASFVKVGGFIVHENPHSYGNHGFYNLNPTWYADFYRQPGFELVALAMTSRNGKRRDDVPRTRRFVFKGPETTILAVAKRTEVLPIHWPMQTKYRHAVPDAGESRAIAVAG